MLESNVRLAWSVYTSISDNKMKFLKYFNAEMIENSSFSVTVYLLSTAELLTEISYDVLILIECCAHSLFGSIRFQFELL